MVRCTGRAVRGSIGGMSQETSREASHAMPDDTPETTTPDTATTPPLGRSTIDRLPARVREAVNKAVTDGATIDEITARISGEGHDCSRSAVGRYAKTMRDLIRQQQETDRAIEAWARALGERTQGQAGLVLIETLRAMTLATMAALNAREEPVSLEELGRLSHVLKRIESTDRLRLQRERAAAKAAAEDAAAAEQARPMKKGLSPETVALIDEAVLGKARWPVRTVTSVPVDPWTPAESHFVPPDPGQSRSGNGSDVSGSGPQPAAAPMSPW